MRISPPYVVIETWIWNDPRVRGLDREARGLFGWLMTCPLMSKVPGLIVAGSGALKDEYQVSEAEFLETFSRLEAAGLATADWAARVVYLPPLLAEMECNRPTSISQATCFGKVIFKTAPKCALLERVDYDLHTLLCSSPSLTESYLRCRPMSNADVRRAAGLPLLAQQRTEDPLLHEGHQLGLNLGHAAPASSGAGEVFLATSSTLPKSDDDNLRSPALEVVAGGDPERELAAGLQALEAQAGVALGPLTEGQRAVMRFAWTSAHAAGWRQQDLADLGAWIGAGNLRWLNKITPAAYLSSHLGEALGKMAEHRRRHGRMPPAPVTGPGAARRIHWFTVGDKVSGCMCGAEYVHIVVGDPWQTATMDRLHRRYLAGDLLTVAEIRAALARPMSAASTADHRMPEMDGADVDSEDAATG